MRAGGLPPIDAVLAVQRLEELGERSDRLRRPQDQDAIRLQRVVEERDHALLQDRSQVDEHVAAGDEIEMGEGRILGDVLPGEHAALADPPPHLEVMVGLFEVAAQALGADVGGDALGIDAGTGTVDGGLAQVRGEDLDGNLGRLLLQVLVEEDGHGVGLLSGGTAGDPDADGPVGGPVLQEPREDDGPQGLVQGGLAEKARDVDQDVVEECLNLNPVPGQQLHVGIDPIQTVQHDPAEDAPLQGRALVEREVHVRDLAEDGQDGIHRVRGFLRPVGLEVEPVRVLADLHQLARDLLGGQHEVHATGLDGAPRHAVELGRFAVLREGEAAGRLDGAQALGSVGAAAGQHDADRPDVRLRRQRLEELVHGVVQARRPWLQAQDAVHELDLSAGRHDVDVVFLPARAVPRLLDGHLGGPGQDVG